MKRRLTLVFGALVGLSACGGGGSSEPMTVMLDPPAFATRELAVEQALRVSTIIDDVGVTAPDDVRDSGSAIYEGSIALNDLSDAEIPTASVIGGIAINIDFADASKITGTAENFLDVNDDLVMGSLELSNASFQQGSLGSGFVAELDGTLENLGGTSDFTYDLGIAVVYNGEDTEALRGFVNGTATDGTDVRPIAGASYLE